MATINAVNNSSFTSATAITITSGNLAISSGNLTLPTTTSSVGQIQWNSVAGVHTYGTRNIFAGQGAGNFTNTSSDNSGVGYNALSAITTGTSGAGQNCALGSGALQSLTSGYNNQAVGYNAMNLATTGNGNTAFGSLALSALVGGSGNSCYGYNAGSAYTGSESNNICLMNVGVASESNVMRLGTTGTGSGQVSTCYLAGTAGATVTGSAVLIASNDQLGLAVSARRYKTDIEDMGDQSSPLMKLRPVTFTYNFDETKTKQYGLIAEEVVDIMPELVGYNKEGLINTVHYHNMPAILLNEMQKQQKLIDSLEVMIAKLEEKA